jgi:NRAMP (natural resistance-associated macrophage protein)-like metal ion transporter
MEIAIAATDLAEVIGSAVALNLLFGIPVWSGVLITAVDTLFILVFGTKSFRSLEVIVFLLCALIVGVFAYELAVVKPEWVKVAAGLIPNPEIITNPDTLFNAIGILGATVMPHSLFLHSSIIQTRAYPRTKEGQKMALKYGRWDSGLSLMLAFFVNAAILILAAAAFHYGPNKNVSVANITQAYELLAPALGSRAAKILFGVGLLASGQNSTIIGTLAGQVVMEGFLQIRIKPWLRRLITRSIAIIPAAIVAGVGGNSGAGRLLVLSQVILSFTLIFAVVPLVHFTSSRAKMGSFVNCWFTRIAAILIAILIAGLNAYLIVQSIRFKSFGSAGNA